MNCRKVSLRAAALLLSLALAAGFAPRTLSAGDAPSSWARDDIGYIIGRQIVRPDLLANYKATMTRLHFTLALVDLADALQAELGQASPVSTFSDCQNYDILRAHAGGLVTGEGGGRFNPDGALQRQMAITMLYRLLGKVAAYKEADIENTLAAFSDSATVAGWARTPMGYMAAAGVVRGSGGALIPARNLTVEEALTLVANVHALIADTPVTLSSSGRTAVIGQSADSLQAQWGAPGRTAQSAYSFQWWVYNSDYENFTMLGIENNTVVAFYAMGGYTLSGTGETGRYTYVGDGLTEYAAYYINAPAAPLNDARLAAYEWEIYDITNAFRAVNGLPPLAYDMPLSAVARAHSADMAQNDYFSHTGFNNSSPFDRMKNAGLSYLSAGENIAAGSLDGIETMNQWINSNGHRENILRDSFTHLGVGAAHQDGSVYRYYYTQCFIGVG